jgi:hypothetical protein
MQRREALRFIGNTALISTITPPIISFAASDEPANEDVSTVKLVLIFDSAAGDQDRVRELLTAATPSLTERNSAWANELRIWDIQVHRREIAAFVGEYGPNTQEFRWPVLLRVPDDFAAAIREVELWNLDWLDYRSLKIDGCYPVSDSRSWWSVEGNWNPTVQICCDHLLGSPNHTGGNFEAPWLESLTFGEIQSLHSDHHWEMIGRGRVIWDRVNVECPLTR